ncbi:MAG: 30S ribosomal protein S13 [Patescibacteria group bacterium]
MARIAGLNIDDKKRIPYGLALIYGIGIAKGKEICQRLKISESLKFSDLTEAEIDKIRSFIDKNYKIEGDLRTEITQNVKRLKEISAYRGVRHIKNLPVRGQRTKTNARTKRGRKVTVGSGRKKAAEKT